MLLGGGRGSDGYKAMAAGAQVYNLYGPVTWTLEPQDMLPPSLPDGMTEIAALPGIELGNMPPLTMVQ